jgi:hypothetical protein
MTPIEAIKYFGIIKIENKNSKGEVTQTLLDFRFPNRCEHGHKTDATAMKAFALGVLECLEPRALTEPKTQLKQNA